MKVATTVFTPLEYSACGYSEEAAIEKFGEHSVEVYHRKFWPLEWTIAGHDPQLCYMKVKVFLSLKFLNLVQCITLRDQPDGKEPVIGLHYVGPNAGEVMQGFSAAMKAGIDKQTLDNTVGIHPVNAEWITDMSITKRSGVELQQSGC